MYALQSRVVKYHDDYLNIKFTRFHLFEQHYWEDT